MCLAHLARKALQVPDAVVDGVMVVRRRLVLAYVPVRLEDAEARAGGHLGLVVGRRRRHHHHHHVGSVGGGDAVRNLCPLGQFPFLLPFG